MSLGLVFSPTTRVGLTLQSVQTLFYAADGGFAIGWGTLKLSAGSLSLLICSCPGGRADLLDLELTLEDSPQPPAHCSPHLRQATAMCRHGSGASQLPDTQPWAWDVYTRGSHTEHPFSARYRARSLSGAGSSWAQKATLQGRQCVHWTEQEREAGKVT